MFFCFFGKRKGVERRRKEKVGKKWILGKRKKRERDEKKKLNLTSKKRITLKFRKPTSLNTSFKINIILYHIKIKIR